MSAPPPPRTRITAARLWERQGTGGKLYLAGRMGGVRVLVVPNPDQLDEAQPGYLLVLDQTELPATRKPQKEQTS